MGTPINIPVAHICYYSHQASCQKCPIGINANIPNGNATMQARSAIEFGAALRQARLARGLTQRALAEAISVTQSAISKVEKGNPGASLGLIFQILNALQTPLTMPMAGEPMRTPLLDDDDEDFVDLDAIANTGLKRK
ncbi:MAG: XRE family transcriptional regulator [Alphaproteobacteria bacterium]|nr:XRE family transcriptional regulator [Alphaproteobacteria bacterium]